MPLVLSTLQQAIESALSRQPNDTQDNHKAVSEALAAAIDKYIRSGQVTGTITGTSPSGPVTGTIITGSLQ